MEPQKTTDETHQSIIVFDRSLTSDSCARRIFLKNHYQS
jgi:hypothetical protein